MSSLLKEYIRLALEEAGRVSLSEIADPPGGWKFFHITPNDLGKTFTFTPQVPTWAASYTQSEDFTTPRVSLATSVESAIHGKFGDPSPQNFGQHEMFVYATQHIPKMQVPKAGKDLDDPENPWGNDWSWEVYAEKNGLDPADEDAHAKTIQGRVSDDPHQTHEVWSLAPIKMTLAGRLWLDNPRSPTKINQKWLLRPDVDEGVATTKNLDLEDPGTIVEPDVRRKVGKYLKKMGLMRGKAPRRPKGPNRKTRLV